jgi:hypothetical protein
MVVTNAQVSDHAGHKIIKSVFIDILVSNIEIILPAENAS